MATGAGLASSRDHTTVSFCGALPRALLWPDSSLWCGGRLQVAGGRRPGEAGGGREAELLHGPPRAALGGKVDFPMRTHCPLQ